MEIKKIGLFSAHSFKKPGGVQNHVLELYREFSHRGISTKIIAPGKIRPEGIPKEDVFMVGISRRVPANKSRADFSVSIRKKFREKIRDENFDVLHFHNLGFGPLSYQILRNSTSSTNIFTVHTTADASHWAKIPGTKTILQRIYAPRFHGLIAVSPSALETVETFGGFTGGPVKLITNGINLDRFNQDIIPLSDAFAGRLNILFVGRFEKRKGLLDALNALKYLLDELNITGIRFIIVGDGEQRNVAQRFIKSNNLEKYVYMAGNVPDSALPSFYRTADIFCAPSISGESFGITLLEAMACGTPIAGYDNPGYRYAMQGHESTVGTNLLVTPGDYTALAKKIAGFIDDRELYSRAKSWGLLHCQQFAWPKIADQILEFYRDVQNSRV